LAMMFSKLIKLKFTNRDSILMKLALAIYMEYYSNSKIKTVEELMATHEYINITNIINDIYYGSIIVTLYFTEQWKN
jgi:UDP-3-O-acyl-N-acetylglucosamine deacetylase